VSAIVQLVARLLLLPAYMVAAAVLVKGYASTGDGFAAGTIAALGILIQYVAFGEREARRLLGLRTSEGMAGAGLLLMVAVAFGPALSGAPILTHYPRPGEHLTRLGSLEVHTATLFDLGVFLLTFGFLVRTMAWLVRAGERAGGPAAEP
jgi:multisubunit Na+/H+ antiporter MnhB subunit